jgi:hypothetical protein
MHNLHAQQVVFNLLHALHPGLNNIHAQQVVLRLLRAIHGRQLYLF